MQKAGAATPSFASNLLENHTFEGPEQEIVGQWTAASMYAGGSDTVRRIPGTIIG